jgi:hypothetical protein
MVFCDTLVPCQLCTNYIVWRNVSKNIFFPKIKMLWRKIENILKYLRTSYFEHGIFKINLLFDQHVLKLPHVHCPLLTGRSTNYNNCAGNINSNNRSVNRELVTIQWKTRANQESLEHHPLGSWVNQHLHWYHGKNPKIFRLLLTMTDVSPKDQTKVSEPKFNTSSVKDRH